MSETPTEQDIILEGIQMAIEANAASMIMVNARVAQIAIHLGIDVSEPKLSEIEARNKEHMLQSVGTRLQKIMQMSAQMQGLDTPTAEEMATALQEAKDVIWPDGSVAGTQPDSNARRINDAIAEKNDGEVLDSTVPNGLDDEQTAAFIKAVENAEPVSPENLFADSIFEDSEPVDMSELHLKDGTLYTSEGEPVGTLEDDSTVDEDTAAYNEKMRQAIEAEEPLFKSYRNMLARGFTVTVAGSDEFDDIDATSEEARQGRWNEIVDFYVEATKKAYHDKWITGPWAERLVQEFTNPLDDAEMPEGSLVIPDPGEVSQGVAQAAAQGDTEITITGLSGEDQIVEALLTAFMVTAARFNMVVSAAMLEDRLAQLGMSAS